MKLSSIILGNLVYSSVEGFNKSIERYLYDYPMCESVDQCKGEQSKLKTHECKGKVVQATNKKRGRVRQRGYDDIFHCRWEVKVPKGKQIKVRIQKDSFGAEHHKVCGFDKLFVMDGEDNRYGRLCSSKDGSGIHNGLSAIDSYNGQKISDTVWDKRSVLLSSNHLVLAFDSDQNNSQEKGGFNVLWEIYEKNDVADGTKEEFAGYFDKITDIIDDVFDGSEYRKENRQEAIQKARKALKKMTQKVFNKIETVWYICGTASNDPNYTNMVRNGGQKVGDMLADPKSGLLRWVNINLDGCRASHLNRAGDNIQKIVDFITKRACTFVNEIHCPQ